MYCPAHFTENRLDHLFALMEASPLGILVTQAGGTLDANHIPFHLARDEGDHGTLTCHVARANPVWSSLRDGDEVMVIFRAGDAYVSPSWYPSKQDHHRQVPTWNYMVVHAHGRVAVRDEVRFVRRNVALLTHRHEADKATPWKMGDAPRDYTEQLLSAIVGLEIRITGLTGKSKLSQNKDERDLVSAGTALAERGEGVIGQAMLAAARNDP